MKFIEDPGIYLPDNDAHFSQPNPKNKGRPVAAGYQKDRLKAAYPYVKVWERAVDVGAHVGLITLRLAERFYLVHAFEPYAPNRECLEANVKGLTNVCVRSCALGDDERSWGSMLVSDQNSGNPQLVASAEGPTVTIKTLDSFDLAGVGLIKIDVQGYELPVVRGAVETLLRCRPVVIVECEEAGKLAYDHGFSPMAAVSFLEGLGAKVEKRISSDHIMVFP